MDSQNSIKLCPCLAMWTSPGYNDILYSRVEDALVDLKVYILDTRIELLSFFEQVSNLSPQVFSRMISDVYRVSNSIVPGIWSTFIFKEMYTLWSTNQSELFCAVGFDGEEDCLSFSRIACCPYAYVDLETDTPEVLQQRLSESYFKYYNITV